MVILITLSMVYKMINYIFFDTMFGLINHSNKDYYYYNIQAEYEKNRRCFRGREIYFSSKIHNKKSEKNTLR